MISLAHLSGPARLAMRALWVAAVAGVAGFAALIAFGSPDTITAGYQTFYVCIYLGPAALCIARAVMLRSERIAWAAFGVGMICWAAGYAYYFAVLSTLESPPYPSPSDAVWLLYYIGAFVGLLILMRVRVRNFRPGLWIDAVVGGLAIAALGAALLVDPILGATSGSSAAVATNLAYPLFDVLIVSLVLGVFGLSNWRPGRGWILLGAVFASHVVFDTIFLYRVAGGTYEAGTLLDATWPALMLLIALAAWMKPEATQGTKTQGWPALAITSGFAVIGLSITVYDHWHPINDVAVVLAALTLAAAFVRTAMTFGDMRTLAHGRELLVQHQSILNAAGEGIYGLDPEGRTTFANPAAARLTGYTVDELVGSRGHELVQQTRSDGAAFADADSPMAAALRAGTVHRTEDARYRRRDGTSFPAEYTSTPMLEHGGVKGTVVVFKDITDRREVERAKDEFTSVVSHELRTPLTSIRGSLGLLQSGVLGPLPEKGQRMIEIAVENTDRLVRLINDILDIERIDSGQIDMHQERCDTAELVRSAIQSVAQVAAQAEVELVAETEAIAVVADPDRILQTLTNLISNAIKFSPAGTAVRVSCERRGEEVCFAVRDEGRGIPSDKLETIFERFQQVDASDSREKGGTGLGLAICRTIVERHGGRIWADSELGAGSTFSFVLPHRAPRERAGAPVTAGDGPLVLVCDDDPAVVEVVSAVLSQRGYRVTHAHSGEEALERALADGPDVILLDLLMPGMSGWETAAALREQAGTTTTPIVMLSVLSEAESENPGADVSDWISKPLDEDALFEALERAIGSRTEPFKVLVVEDDPDLAAILTATFERRGIETFHAADGREAIELSQQVLPDLLVLDLGLPETDGFQVVDWLRRHERLNALPMVVYTARELDSADRERLRLGAGTEFLTKGRVSPQDFEARVLSLLGRLTHDHAPEKSDEPEAHPVGR